MTARGPQHGERGPSSSSTNIGRRIAFEAISAFRQRQAFISRVVEDRATQLRASPAERAFAVELAAGVVRRQATLDSLLPPFVDRPRSNIEDALWTLLQLGAYQLVLTDIPPHAAVSETAQVAKEIGRPGWVGVINGVLRAVSRDVTDEHCDQPGSDRVPLVDGRYRRMRCGVLPDPAVDPVLYLAKAHSYPRWLVRDWVDRWGITETTRLCEWFNRPPTLTLRVNRLVQSRDAMLQALHAAGVSATAGQCEEAIGLQQSINVRTLPGFDDGWFSVQDESAMSAARLLQPQSGERILDLCAAPGGKTTHLAELMQNQGQIMAVDADAARLQTVLDNARRLQLNIIEVASVSATGDDLPPGPFDAALVDVPCSNTGVLGKRPEARWRITAAGIDELVQTQYRLLLQACEHVRPGGQIVYSTCSIEPRENRQLVDRVLAEQSQLELVRDVTHVPGQPGDGGYQTLLRRGD